MARDIAQLIEPRKFQGPGFGVQYYQEIRIPTLLDFKLNGERHTVNKSQRLIIIMQNNLGWEGCAPVLDKVAK